MVDGIRAIARSCGYAIGEHGSRIRDLDLIAVPWVEWAIAPELLALALVVGLELHVAQDARTEVERGLVPKPHGRVGWVFLKFTDASWEVGDAWRPPRQIDLSVMPLRED